MGRKYKIRNQESIYFITITVIFWLDTFTRKSSKDIIIESLKYCQKEKDLEIYAWCIITNHIHLIIGSEGKCKLEDFKRFTSNKIIQSIKENNEESRKDFFLFMFKNAGIKNSRNKIYQFWQQNNHPIDLSHFSMVEQRLNYIHQNPVKAGFVDKSFHWTYIQLFKSKFKNNTYEIATGSILII